MAAGDVHVATLAPAVLRHGARGGPPARAPVHHRVRRPEPPRGGDRQVQEAGQAHGRAQDVAGAAGHAARCQQRAASF